jgi:hypothetical protein
MKKAESRSPSVFSSREKQGAALRIKQAGSQSEAVYFASGTRSLILPIGSYARNLSRVPIA